MAKRPPWVGDRGDVNNDGIIDSDDFNRIKNHASGVTPITDAAALKRAVCTIVSADSGANDSMNVAIGSDDSTYLAYYFNKDISQTGSLVFRMTLSAYTGLQKDGYGILYYNPVESSLSITAKNDKTIAATSYDWDEVT